MSFIRDRIWQAGFRRVVKASGAETASTTHAAVGTAAYGTVVVEVDVTAASGTGPTLLLVVEGSIDGTTWFQLGQVGANGYSTGMSAAPSNINAVDHSFGAFPAARYVRTRSVIGGTTPSFTYSVAVEVC
jgi:hypothetical protein